MKSVLLLTADRATEERWSQALRGELSLRTFPSADPPPDDAQIDVVLSDGTLPDQAAAWMGRFPAALLVRVGEAAGGDVRLPADCLPRELQLACRLGAEIARLRRQGPGPAPRAENDLSLVDELTGLPNRRAWQQELARRCHDALAAGAGLCLALVDLDHFKQVNAGWGHAAGDRLLAASARALRAGLRPQDFVARLGGDEFGLLLAAVRPDVAAVVVERVRAGVPILAAREAPHVVGASAGFVWTGDPQHVTAESLFAAADRALALAKQQGRDCTVRGDA